MITGVLTYEDRDCNIQTVDFTGSKLEIDVKAKKVLDSLDAVYLHLLYVDPIDATVINAEW